MPKYKIEYSFTGKGTTLIEADNQNAAEDMFDEGDYTPENEEYYNNDITEIKVVKKKGTNQ